jgi:serine/threonine-protein kinase SRK2
MQNYEYIKTLGKGGYGVVQLFKNKTSKELEAIKFLPRGDNITGDVVREIQNLMMLDNTFIIGFNKVFLTDDHLCISMEYGNGGELFDIVRKRGYLEEDVARYFFQQVVKAVKHCHDNHIAHRDIKLENILLSVDASGVPHVKLCDFGLSKREEEGLSKTLVGTPCYMSPEMFEAVANDGDYDGTQADVWACAVSLYVMLFGIFPFDDPKSPRDVFKMMKNIMAVRMNKPTAQVSSDCLDLLSKMFVKNPENRYTLSQVMEHPWFNVNIQDTHYHEKRQTRARRNFQSHEDIRRMVNVARAIRPPPEAYRRSKTTGAIGLGKHEDHTSLGREGSFTIGTLADHFNDSDE